MDIKKATGEKEKFNEQKLCSSIVHAGTPKSVAEAVCGIVKKELKPGMTTSNIFRATLRELVKEDLHTAAKYSLRRALLRLGPAGFVFEQYVEALLRTHDYKTRRGIMMQGACVEHEVDVYAEKGDLHFVVEAKYHNEDGLKTHINQVMYADARLMDIERRHAKNEKSPTDHVMWVITNTKFTEKAIQYAECRGIKLVGWNYPAEGNLEQMIIRKKMYPVTVLPSVTRNNLAAFAKHNMVLAQDLLPYSAESLALDFNINPKKAQKIISEVRQLVD